MSDELLFTDESQLRTDCLLAIRALRNRWPISPERRQFVAEKAVELCEHKDPRVALRACQLVAQLELQSQKDHHKLLEVALAERKSVPHVSLTSIQCEKVELEDVYRLLDQL